MSLDFSRAFDKVHHSTLLQKLTDATLPTGLVLWIKNYLAERSYEVRIQGQNSNIYQIQEGVPQGSVLGPVLFATLVGDLCSAITEEHTLVQYADDATLSSHFTTEIRTLLAAYYQSSWQRYRDGAQSTNKT